MKSKLIWLLSLILITFFTNCKKSEQSQPSSSTEPDPFMISNSVSAADIGTTNKVVTIAGKAYTPGSADGLGSAARFNGPTGIQLLKDGSLYVADRYNNAIRKITPGYQVSTEKLNSDSVGYGIYQPLYVGEDDKKNMHIVARLEGGDGTEEWLFNASRKFLSEQGLFYVTHAFLAKDPYRDLFWTNSGYGVSPSFGSVLNLTSTKSFYAGALFGDPDGERERGFIFSGLCAGGNNVIYFAYNGALYKHTPSGVDARIDMTLPLGRITSIIVNADCKTMYLAADGYIKRIVNGTVAKLAGPNTAHPDGRDGVGFEADVNANSLALGDHENAIYFSDTKTHTIRKLQLK